MSPHNDAITMIVPFENQSNQSIIPDNVASLSSHTVDDLSWTLCNNNDGAAAMTTDIVTTNHTRNNVGHDLSRQQHVMYRDRNHPHHNHFPTTATTGNNNNYNSDNINNINSNSGDDSSSVRRDREREGRCADCGAQTHAVRCHPETGSMQKEPLNVENEVHRGRCLLCHPLPMMRLQQQQPPQHLPQHLPQHHLSLQPQQPLQQHQSYWFDSSRSLNLNGTESDSVHSGSQSYHSAPIIGWSAPPTNLQQQQQQHLSHPQGGYHPQHPHQHHLSHGLSHSGGSPLGGQYHSVNTVGGGAPPLGEFIIYSQQRNHHRTQPQHQQHQHQQQASHPGSKLSIHISPSTADGSSHMNITSTNNNSNINNNNINSNMDQNQPTPPPRESQLEEDEDICQILSTMRHHPTHTPTQITSLHSLWVLSYESENAAAIGRVGGIPTILDAMRLHARCMSIQSNGIASLQNLAVNDYNRDTIADSGGIATIVDAMSRFLENEELQQCGCTALANLANGSMDHKISISECGGILAVIRAVEWHSEVESVLRAAYRSLRKLGYNPGNNEGRVGDEEDEENDEGQDDEDDDDEDEEEVGDDDDDGCSDGEETIDEDDSMDETG